jgi:hypothetical protein
MWIYKVKTGHLGHASRFKARFVAKGCSQREGIDYTKNFSHVVRIASLRFFVTMSGAVDHDFFERDIDTTFLYAPMKEDGYVKQPLGFADGTTKVCHLRRCLYGLKQSPREFNQLLRDWLIS